MSFKKYLTEMQMSIVTYDPFTIDHYKKWNKSAGKQIIGLEGDPIEDSMVLSPFTTARWNKENELEISTVSSGKQGKMVLQKHEADLLKKIL